MQSCLRIALAVACVWRAGGTSTCVYHLHIPKCAGTFLWRFLNPRFCPNASRVCARNAPAPPPACDCVVNPITKRPDVLRAVEVGAYRFVSAHSLAPLGASRACALAVWFRDPAKRVVSHWGYVRYRRGENVSALSAIYQRRRTALPNWVSNQQWSLLLPRFVPRGGAKMAGSASPSSADAEVAAAAVDALGFVGIVERMGESLCVFARELLPPSSRQELCEASEARQPAAENVAVRPPTSEDAKELVLIRRHNRYDALLYTLAQDEFVRRRARTLGPPEDLESAVSPRGPLPMLPASQAREAGLASPGST